MDIIAEKIFDKKVFDKNKLLEYGFKEVNTGEYLYVQNILDNQFEIRVSVLLSGEIKTRLLDNSTGDLYTLHLSETSKGSFIGQVREAYESVLDSIAKNCCICTYFKNSQTNRVTERIKDKYGDNPEFLWENLSGTAVFRNFENKKWYGVVCYINKSKLDSESDSQVEILNVKLDENEIVELLKLNGFYKAYHMNKKYWITIILDETVDDELIIELVSKSHKYTEKKAKT